MKIQAVTIGVSDLARSKAFYEDVLGFEADMYYEETRWQSYRCEETAFFAIAEAENVERPTGAGIVNFMVDDVEGLWERIRGTVEVESGPARTPWGAYKMVVVDPDGYRLGFVQA